jgi:hypothetical protein
MQEIKFTKTEKKLMKKAIKVLNERGWNRGWFTSTEGGVCAVGALNVAAGYDPSNTPDVVTRLVEQKLDVLVARNKRNGCTCLTDYNDASEDGKRPIVRLFERLSK